MNEKDKMPFDFRLWEALKQKCCIKPDQANTIVFLGAERFLEAIGPVIKQYRNDIQREAHTAAFKQSLAAIHDLLPTSAGAGNFKESAIKAIEAAANTEEGEGNASQTR